jgi:hypothetical protein
MPIIGSADLEVSANVDTAIANVLRLRQEARNSFNEIAAAIQNADHNFKQFGNISPALKDFKNLSATLSALDGEIRSLEGSAKGLELKAPFVQALNTLKDLRAEVAKGIGDPKTSGKEEAALQSELFRQQTQEAHDAALAKERAFTEATEVAKKNIVEEQQLQRALFLSATQGAHEAALAKERAYAQSAAAAKKAAVAERQVQERLGAELAASINRFHPGLAKNRQADFDALIAKASGVTQASGKLSSAFERVAASGGLAGKAAGSLSGLFAAAENKLAGFGLSVSDIAIVLGAGFAGGVAGAIQIGKQLLETLAHMTEAVVKFLFNAAKLASTFQQLQQVTGQAVGGARKEVEAFVESAVTRFGLAEESTTRFINRTSRLFQSFSGIGKEASGRLSAGLVQASEVLRVTSGSGLSANDALDRMFNTISGNIEGLREFGIFLQEADLKAVAAANGIKLTDSTLSNFERGLLATIAAIDHSLAATDDYNNANDTMAHQLEVTHAQIESLKKAIGEELVPVFLVILQAFKRFLDILLGTAKAIKGARREINEFFKEHPALKRAIDGATEAFLKQHPILEGVARAVGALAESDKKAAQSADDLRAARELAVEALKKEELAEKNRKKGEFLDDIKQQRQARDLIQARIDAEVEGNRRVADARQRIRDAEEDNAKKSRDLAKRNSDAIEDANRAVNQAEQRLSDARQDRAFRDKQAAERTAAAIQAANRANRDAEERLSDFTRDSRRRIEDLRERIRRLQHQSRQDLFDIHVQIINANLRGQNALANAASAQLAALARTSQGGNLEELRNAERDLRREQEDAALQLSRLQRDLTETRLDGIDKVKKAQAEEARARLESARQVRDAEEAVNEALRRRERVYRDVADAVRDLARENSRAIRDASKAFADAVRDRDKAIAKAEEDLQEFVESLNFLVLELAQVLNALGVLSDEALKAIRDLQESRMVSQAAKTFRFAHGGDVAPFTPAIWNETASNPRGELLITPSGGTVISHKDFIRLLAALERRDNAGRTPASINIFDRSGSPEATAWATAKAIMRAYQ